MPAARWYADPVPQFVPLTGSKPAKYANRFTDAEKAEALALYVELGPTEAGKRCGMSPATVRNWARAAGVETNVPAARSARVLAGKLMWEERRVILAEGVGDLAEEALELSRDYVATGDARNARDAAATMATAIDKAQLLTGGVTERIGVDETYNNREREIEAARAQAREVASRPVPSPITPAPTPVAGAAPADSQAGDAPPAGGAAPLLPVPQGATVHSPDLPPAAPVSQPATIDKPPRDGIIPVPGP